MYDLTSSVSGSRTSSCIAVQPLFFKSFSSIASEVHPHTRRRALHFSPSGISVSLSSEIERILGTRYINIAD